MAATIQKPISLTEAIQRAYTEVELAEAEVQNALESIEVSAGAGIAERLFSNPAEQALDTFVTEANWIINIAIRGALSKAAQTVENSQFSGLAVSAVKLLEAAAVGFAESAELGRLAIIAKKHSQNADGTFPYLRLIGYVKFSLLKSLRLSQYAKNKLEFDSQRFPNNRPGNIMHVVQDALYAYASVKELSHNVMCSADRIYADIRQVA